MTHNPEIKVYDDYNSKIRKDGIVGTITCNVGVPSPRSGFKIIIGDKVRRLTPLECFRLQGFPDEMIAKAQELKISDRQLYKMAGNAVTVNVIEAIAQKIFEVEYGNT